MIDKKEKCTFPEFQMNSGCAECPIATCSGKQQPDPKPLAQYLAEYLAIGIDRIHDAGMPMDFTEKGLEPIFERALEAYQSTENVTIKIERKYDE